MKISKRDYNQYILPFKKALENMDTEDDDFLAHEKEIILKRISEVEVCSDEEDDLK